MTRSRLRRLGAAFVATASVAALTWAGSATAAVTVGQLAPTPQSPATTCRSDHDYLQPSVTGGNLYSARQAGTMTSWSTNSQGGGSTFTFKVFRRTSDPDVFRVVGRAIAPPLEAGLNTFPTSVQVKSGDLIGLHVAGGPQNPCTFPVPGDGALRSQSTGDVATGQSGQFIPLPGVRLNLSAVLVPSNSFTITGISRNRRSGTARITADLSNPGIATIGGKGLRPSRATTAVARGVSLKVATVGKRKRKLARAGSVKVPVTVTFYPTGGDPSSQIVPVKLKMRRTPPAA